MEQVIHNLTKSVRKRGQDDIRSARKKIARQEQSKNKQRCRCLRFLQVLWLLSAGDMLSSVRPLLAPFRPVEVPVEQHVGVGRVGAGGRHALVHGEDGARRDVAVDV